MTPGYLALFGLFVALWLGGGNLLMRRAITRSKGPLGPPRAVWVHRGLFFAPDWLSYAIVAIGAAIVLTAGTWALVR